jgi:hypothetical protein
LQAQCPLLREGVDVVILRLVLNVFLIASLYPVWTILSYM